MAWSPLRGPEGSLAVIASSSRERGEGEWVEACKNTLQITGQPPQPQPSFGRPRLGGLFCQEKGRRRSRRSARSRNAPFPLPVLLFSFCFFLFWWIGKQGARMPHYMTANDCRSGIGYGAALASSEPLSHAGDDWQATQRVA